MKKKLIIILLVGVLTIHTALAVFAFPGVPFGGTASANGIDVSLNLAVANVGINVLTAATDSAGASATPVLTNGTGDGVTVEVNTGVLPDVEVDLVNALTTKIYDGNSTILEDEDMLVSIDEIASPLVTTGIISSASSSQVTGLIGWSSSDGAVTDASVLGGVGADPIVSALSIFNSTTTETTPAHLLDTHAESALAGVAVEIPTSLFGTISLLTVDVITSTATAASDGTLPNAAASADVEFINLVIDGTPIPIPTANDVYVISRGAIPTDIARVTIMPIMDTSTSATSSSAEAIALFIEVLVDSLAGTEIYLAHSQVETIAESAPSGPTSILFHDGGSIHTADTVTLPIVLGLMAVLTIVSAVVLFKQQRRYSWDDMATSDSMNINP